MSLTEEQMQQIELEIKKKELDSASNQAKFQQLELDTRANEKSMISEQLDLGEELERIDYLLRGWTLVYNKETKNTEWAEPENNDMIILSDFGVHLIRNTIAWYLNKNTLLSNYDDDTILSKMEDFANALNDCIFMEYEKIFQYPTFEDCKNVLKERLDKKKELRIFALELLGKKLTDIEKQEIEQKILNEIEPIIEKELEKIKQQIIKNKLKRFEIIIREVQDSVHSTYLRAFNGMERRTLREHIHISENKGGIQIPQQQRSIMDRITRR